MARSERKGSLLARGPGGPKGIAPRPPGPTLATILSEVSVIIY